MPPVGRNKWKEPSHMWSLGDWANEGIRMLKKPRVSKVPRVELREDLSRYIDDYKKEDSGKFTLSF